MVKYKGGRVDLEFGRESSDRHAIRRLFCSGLKLEALKGEDYMW